MSLRIRVIEHEDDVLRYHAVEDRCTPFDHPGFDAEPPEATVAAFRRPPVIEKAIWLLAEDGDELVGTSVLALPLVDNLDNAWGIVHVLPEHRRRGHGRKIAEHLLELARTEGRRRLVSMVGAPLGVDAPGTPLARGLGGEAALVHLRRRLDLTTVDDAMLDDLRVDQVGTRARGYEVVEWVDEVPAALVADAARMMAAMSTDQPLGDLEWQPESWDDARYREGESEAKARGFRRVAAGAVETATGRMVAYTDIGVAVSRPTLARQWDTIVDGAHRGHRLGLLVKAANLAHLRRVSPTSAGIATSNAASNAHMVAINDLLGFVPVEETTTWQFAL